MTEADVIAAIATGSGRAAIGVIRLSGPELGWFMQSLLGRVISPRRAVLTDFLDAHGCALDTGIALFFPGPHSYTGEDVLELQGHGGPAVLQLLLRRCLVLGARLAQPGEFSRRAFLNEKLDLAQAEAVADLIEASSEAAARAALRSLKGEFSMQIRVLVSGLVALRAQVEACIDFPEDETDTPGEQVAGGQALQRLSDHLHEIQARAVSGKLLRDGAQVVLVGPPNVGKSSLLNRLTGEDVAIVTEFPGTTRDTVRSEFLLEGVPIHLVDTAGLREAEDLVERIGIDRTWKAVREADVVLWVSDVERQSDAERDSILGGIPAATRRIIVLNKIDLVGRRPGLSRTGRETQVEVSAKTAAGIDLLRGAILEATGRLLEGEGVFLARERHLEGLERAAGHLKTAADCVGTQELFAEELRLAQLALGRLTGEFSADDLLGEIFTKFCIGK
jgi:tRNA modification GTPase